MLPDTVPESEPGPNVRKYKGSALHRKHHPDAETHHPSGTVQYPKRYIALQLFHQFTTNTSILFI